MYIDQSQHAMESELNVFVWAATLSDSTEYIIFMIFHRN